MFVGFGSIDRPIVRRIVGFGSIERPILMIGRRGVFSLAAPK
jgi:hypothetical protein